MTTTLLKRAAGVLAAAALASGIAASAATPAQAATARNGVCETGEVCFYYNSNQTGSLSDFNASVGNYGTDPATCYVFKSAGAGQGLCIKNQVASVRNLSGQSVTVYYNSDFAGASQTIANNTVANLNTTLKNNNASHKIGTGQTGGGGSVDNPYGPSWGPNGGWTPRAAWLRDTIKAKFGSDCTTYVTSSGEHANGNGMDCWGSLATRRGIATWAKDNARLLEVYYVIHEQKIWSLPRTSEGWRLMEDRGSATANHYDHVHISMQTPSNEY